MCTFIMMDTLNSLIWFRVVAHTAAWYGRSSLKPEWILEPAGYTRETAMLSIKTETGTFDAVSGRTEESTLYCLSFMQAAALRRTRFKSCMHKKIWWMDGGRINRVYFHVSFSVLHCDSVLPRININKPPFRNQTVGRLSTRGPVKTDII